MVLPIIAVAAIVGVLLVVFGGRSSGPGTSTPASVASTTTSPATNVPDVGDFADGKQLNQAVARLDPATLSAPARSSGGPKAASLATATIERCAAVLPHASIDRGIGRRRAVAAGAIAGRPVLIYSYDAEATDKVPAGIRLFVVDEASCAVEYAQDH